jgi:putative transposase
MSLLHLKSLREPRANKISTSVFFYSPKLNRQVWCESNLEWDTAIVLDHDPSILEYCEQSIELHWSKSNWTPDFVALLEKNGEYKILILEVKYLQELLGDRDHYIQKYSETKEWIQQNFDLIAKQVTKLPIKQIEFHIVTDLILQQSFRVRNCRKLIQAVIEKEPDYLISENIRHIMSGISQISFQALIDAIKALNKKFSFKDEEIYTTIYAMLYRQEIQIDLDALMTPKSIIYDSTYISIGLYPWLTRFDWQNQTQLYTPLLKHEDLFFIAPTPEKSIELWDIANTRMAAILPYLDCPIKEIEQTPLLYQGRQIHWTTIYEWIKRYIGANGDIRALLPHRSSCGRKKDDLNQTRMDLWEFGKTQYLLRERKSIQQAFNIMESYANSQGKLKDCMGYSTFHRRIQSLNGLDVAKKRMGHRNAEKTYELSESEFPHADFPLQSVQIDHTPIDVMVVDEENRLVTKRPYLTIAFDSYTRCVLGYHLTYNEPSRLSIAMALINCVQNKKKDLEKIQAQFPELDKATLTMIQASEWQNVYGLPYTLHMDNGPDFRSDDIRLFGIRYKVHLHYRAVKKPQHGAYVERYLGTLNTGLHALEGTTFSNVTEKKDYPAEKRASFTMKELEARILLEMLTYHNQFHSEIRIAPIKRWQDAFARTTIESAISRNLTQIDPSVFFLDVLPSEMRTVQKSGVQNFGLSYADPRIQPLIGAKNPETPSEHQRFLVRYDPRDIRTLYFYSPLDKGYIPLKCNNHFVQTYYHDQDLTIWQWDTIKRNQKAEYRLPCLDFAGKKFAYIQAQQAIEKEVATRTKSARIKRARQQANADQRQEFMEIADFTPDQSQKESDETSHFPRLGNEEVEFISIPPNEQNPFYGIEVDIKTGEIKRRVN